MNVQKIAFEVIIIHSSSYAGCFHGIQRPFNAVNVINVLNQTRPLFKLNLPIKKGKSNTGVSFMESNHLLLCAGSGCTVVWF